VPESGHWLVVVRSGGARSVVVCLLVLTLVVVMCCVWVRGCVCHYEFGVFLYQGTCPLFLLLNTTIRNSPACSEFLFFFFLTFFLFCLCCLNALFYPLMQ
jgi:uncharacterized protein YggT (Ycf19 family)